MAHLALLASSLVAAAATLRISPPTFSTTGTDLVVRYISGSASCDCGEVGGIGAELPSRKRTYLTQHERNRKRFVSILNCGLLLICADPPKWDGAEPKTCQLRGDSFPAASRQTVDLVSTTMRTTSLASNGCPFCILNPLPRQSTCRDSGATLEIGPGDVRLAR